MVLLKSHTRKDEINHLTSKSAYLSFRDRDAPNNWTTCTRRTEVRVFYFSATISLEHCRRNEQKEDEFIAFLWRIGRDGR